MVTSSEGTARKRSHRAYDQELRGKGATLAPRVDEPVPVCWMCPTTTEPRTDEHIFPRWLLDRLDAGGDVVKPVHRDSIGRKLSDRGPIVLGSFVNGQVCKACNTGWMSVLEAEFQHIYDASRSGRISAADAKTIARWFAKTAIVLNTSQNYRTLVPARIRHQATRRVPAGFSVYLVRRPAGWQGLTWVQGLPLVHAAYESSWDAEQAMIARWLGIAIEVGELIGWVFYSPPREVRPMDDSFVRLWPPGPAMSWESVAITTEDLMLLTAGASTSYDRPPRGS